MPDEVTPGTGVTDVKVEADINAAKAQEANANKKEASPEDELPEWARNELRKVRDEAASRRVEANDLKSKLEKAKSPEEVDAVVKSFQETNGKLETKLARIEAGYAAGLPAELHERLVGSTPEELKADAARLVELFKGNRPASQSGNTPSGGLTPDNSTGPENYDPAQLAAEIGKPGISFVRR